MISKSTRVSSAIDEAWRALARQGSVHAFPGSLAVTVVLHCVESEAQVGGPARLNEFTTLELRVIPWLSSSLSFADIGVQLGVSEAMVKLTAIGVYRKVGVVNRQDAVTRCGRLGRWSPVTGGDNSDEDP